MEYNFRPYPGIAILVVQCMSLLLKNSAWCAKIQDGNSDDYCLPVHR